MIRHIMSEEQGISTCSIIIELLAKTYVSDAVSSDGAGLGNYDLHFVVN